MTNIKGLKRICENGSGCAGCPMRRLCDNLCDLAQVMKMIYDETGAVPGDWSMHQAAHLHEAMTKVLYEMEPKPEYVISDYVKLNIQED